VERRATSTPSKRREPAINPEEDFGMDGDWRAWRHLDELWSGFEEKGWELGPVRYMNLPPVLAEFGPYHISFHYRDYQTGESLFEVREMRGGEERRTVFVWGIPTPEEAESLLERHGLGPDDEAPLETWGSWGGILPPVVHARESLGKEG
jgi:hypothetical protein